MRDGEKLGVSKLWFKSQQPQFTVRTWVACLVPLRLSFPFTHVKHLALAWPSPGQVLAFSPSHFWGPSPRLTSQQRAGCEGRALEEWSYPGTSPYEVGGAGLPSQVPSSWQGHSLKATLSLVLSDIIRYFNPSVLRPLCAPGKTVVAHTGAQ